MMEGKESWAKAAPSSKKMFSAKNLAAWFIGRSMFLLHGTDFNTDLKCNIKLKRISKKLASFLYFF